MAVGLVLGVLGAMLLQAFLAGVSPLDTITVLATGAVVSAAALGASALPAIRVAYVNPLVVLRDG